MSDLHDFENRIWLKDRLQVSRSRNTWRFGGQVIKGLAACTFLPVISGIPTEGETLITSTGTWTNITGLANPFSYQWLRNEAPISGATASSYVLAALDVGASITVAVTATNSFGASSPAFAKPLGPIALPLTISGTPVLTATVGTSYPGFTVTAGGGWVPYLFSVISGAPWPPGISMNARTGIVAGTPTLGGTFANTIIQVTDQYGDTATLPPFTMTVETPIGVVGAPVTMALQNSPYAGFVVSGVGGIPPYSYSVTAGSLPAGIALNSTTGVVSGTPTGAGTSAGIVITVTDALSETASLPAFSLLVTGQLVISGAPNDFATINQPYSSFTVSASGGYPGYSFAVTAGTLPPGIGLNAVTGVVSGTPTVLGTYAGIVVTATDSQGDTASLPAFSIAVGSTPPDSLNFTRPSNSQYQGLA